MRPKPREKLEILQTQEGTLVLTKEGKRLKEQILKARPWDLYLHRQKQKIERGKRMGFFLTLEGGRKIIVKRKNAYESIENRRRLEKDTSVPPQWQEYFVNVRRASVHKVEASAIHEIRMIEIAKRLYRERYHQELPIESPLGCFIRKDGVRFSFFSALPVLPPDSVPPHIKRRQIEWEEKTKERLRALGIEPYDFETVVVKSNGEYRFVIVDAELWYFPNPS